jgi:cytochrome c oxidase assembly factor CtaG
LAADLLSGSLRVIARPVLLAHEGAPLLPHDFWRAWSLEPAVLGGLALAAVLYALGLRRLVRRAGWTGRRRRALAFLAGWLTLAVAMLSPLHALGGALLSAHMVQHELLMLVAAPLLVAARPLVPLLWAFPSSPRRALGRRTSRGAPRALWRALTLPSVAFVLHAVAIWGWHVPALYDATLESEALHAAQHLSFLATALLFWWSLTHGPAAERRWGPAILYVTATMAHTSGLGVLLTLASRPLYPAYVGRTAPWGLTALEDQQLAGLVMWIPAGVGYLVAALVFTWRWIESSGRLATRTALVVALAAVVTLGGAGSACAPRGVDPPTCLTPPASSRCPSGTPPRSPARGRRTLPLSTRRRPPARARAAQQAATRAESRRAKSISG